MVVAVAAFGNVRVDVCAGGAINLPDSWTGTPVTSGDWSSFERNFGNGANLMQIRAGTDVWLVPVIPDSALSVPNQGERTETGE